MDRAQCRQQFCFSEPGLVHFN